MAMAWKARVIPLSEAVEEDGNLGTWEPISTFKDEGDVFLVVKAMFEVEGERSTVVDGPLKEWRPEEATE